MVFCVWFDAELVILFDLFGENFMNLPISALNSADICLLESKSIKKSSAWYENEMSSIVIKITFPSLVCDNST